MSRNRGKPVMLLNGRPVYATPEPTAPVTVAMLVNLATKITGSRDTARARVERPNRGLQGRSPREAVRDGDGLDAARLLWRFTGW